MIFPGAASLDLVLGGRAVSWWLLAEKAVFIPSDQTLLVSDLHLGKAGHFRRHGIAIPRDSNLENLARLTRLMDGLKPHHLLLLGDLFHSDLNPEWDVFVDWLDEERQRLPSLQVTLVLGNHDTGIPLDALSAAGISYVSSLHWSDGIVFSHAPEDPIPPGTSLHVCGHWHPGVRLRGGGRQSLRLPCYFLTEMRTGTEGELRSQTGTGSGTGAGTGWRLVLPAFGSFTGLHTVTPRKSDRIFVIAEDQVLPL